MYTKLIIDLPRPMLQQSDANIIHSVSEERIIAKARRVAKEKGTGYVARAGFRRIKRRLSLSFWHSYYRVFKSHRKFAFQQNKYTYFYHKYNMTWVNERAVEVPIVWKYVKECKGAVLEVGSVLPHYFPFQHDVVDKYEKGENIINEDAASMKLEKKYDLIVCISTLEHVGWDESPSDQKIMNTPEKILRAIDNMKQVLNAKGKIIITVPLGYNPGLDDLIKTGRINFDKQFYLKRISTDNRWVETGWENVAQSKFHSPYPFANGLLVGVIENQ
jgi:SAM-dependent methyltransferase